MSTSIYISCFGAGILFGIGFYCCLRRLLAYQKTRRRQQQYYNNKSNNNPNIIWDWQYHSEKCAQCLTECELCLTNIEHSQHSHLVPFKVDSNDYAIMEPQNVSRGKQNLSIIMEEAWKLKKRWLIESTLPSCQKNLKTEEFYRKIHSH